MGPNLIPDKSIIQGSNYSSFSILSPYYQKLIPPILKKEMHSMFAKETNDGSKNKKTASANTAKSILCGAIDIPEAHFLAYNNLLGSFIPMDGRIPTNNINNINNVGQKGIFIDESQGIHKLRELGLGKGEISDKDFEQASIYRKKHENLGLEMLNSLKEIDLNDENLAKIKKPKDLFLWLETEYFPSLNKKKLFNQVANFILSPQHISQAKKYWRANNFPLIQELAPYAFYFYKVWLFYILGIQLGLIKKNLNDDKPHLDMQYIFYLPFTKVFSTADKGLKDVAILFLRDNQFFISKEEWETDATLIKETLDYLSEEEKTDLYSKIGFAPPYIKDCKISNFWLEIKRGYVANKHISDNLRLYEEKKGFNIDYTLKN